MSDFFVDVMFRHALSPLLIVSTVLLAGCHEAVPELGTVTGTVSMKGRPLDGISIVFSPDPSQGVAPRSSRGLTDQNGKYSLDYRTVKGQTEAGAAIGKHLITMEDFRCLNSRDKPLPYRISVRLSKFSTSPLREEVKAGEQTVDFDLTEYANRK